MSLADHMRNAEAIRITLNGVVEIPTHTVEIMSADPVRVAIDGASRPYTAEASIRVRRRDWRRLVRWASRGAANTVWLGRIGGRRAFARDLRMWS